MKSLPSSFKLSPDKHYVIQTDRHTATITSAVLTDGIIQCKRVTHEGLFAMCIEFSSVIAIMEYDAQLSVRVQHNSYRDSQITDLTAIVRYNELLATATAKGYIKPSKPKVEIEEPSPSASSASNDKIEIQTSVPADPSTDDQRSVRPPVIVPASAASPDVDIPAPR